ncbi:PARP10_14_15 [Acanthosepion pharaonis]|uniref:PARP10_14_15 n=1 Tax=Acanthosepion pharaonis TaxID=158019 RepID=A0A812DQA5_ACAPH|nr:PARP10_14_15 [Sepia pharaonis]
MDDVFNILKTPSAETPNMEDSSRSSESDTKLLDTSPKECSVDVIKGSITDMKVDVVVGSTDSRYKLPCNFVFFGSIPENDGKPNITTFVEACLQRATLLNFSSIAFPALGTGNLGYKPKVVVEQMASAIRKFKTTTPESSLKNIIIVIYPDEKKMDDFFKLKKLSTIVKVFSFTFSPCILVALLKTKSFIILFFTSPAKVFSFTFSPCILVALSFRNLLFFFILHLLQNASCIPFSPLQKLHYIKDSILFNLLLLIHFLSLHPTRIA